MSKNFSNIPGKRKYENIDEIKSKKLSKTDSIRSKSVIENNVLFKEKPIKIKVNRFSKSIPQKNIEENKLNEIKVFDGIEEKVLIKDLVKSLADREASVYENIFRINKLNKEIKENIMNNLLTKKIDLFELELLNEYFINLQNYIPKKQANYDKNSDEFNNLRKDRLLNIERSLNLLGNSNKKKEMIISAIDQKNNLCKLEEIKVNFLLIKL